jgi:hypothetical protein
METWRPIFFVGGMPMEFLKKLTSRFVKNASEAISDSVKEEAKGVLVETLPTLIGIGFAVIGFAMFKASMTKVTPSISSVVPTLSRTSVVTNNWFFDEATGKEVLSKIVWH